MPPKTLVPQSRDDTPCPSPSIAPEPPESIAQSDDAEPPVEYDYDGIDWARLPDLMRSQTVSKQSASWIYNYGYKCALRRDPKTIIFVCKYCHQHKKPGGRFTGRATSSAINHLNKQSPGHGFDKYGKINMEKPRSQPSIYNSLIGRGVEVSQTIANSLSFQSDDFRRVAVQWLIDGNHPLREFESPAFQAMITAANPLAEEALWKNRQSVTKYIIYQYQSFLPIVRRHLAQSLSKIHISFDGWTIKGGKKSFNGMFVHHVSEKDGVKDYPLALPTLSGAHTGERIGEVVYEVLQAFEICDNQVGYFVLDNAGNNDTAVETLADIYGFNGPERRCRCCWRVLFLARAKPVTCIT